MGIYLFSIREKQIMLEETKIKLETASNEFGKNPEEISIITVYDNYSIDSRLKAGWGFSCLIKTENKNIL